MGKTPSSYLGISIKVLCFDSKGISCRTATEEAHETGEKNE